MTGLSGLLLCQGNLLSLDRRKDDGKVTEYWTRLGVSDLLSGYQYLVKGLRGFIILI